jgi:hypothetical protein
VVVVRSDVDRGSQVGNVTTERWQRASAGGVFDNHREYLSTCTYCLVTQSAAAATGARAAGRQASYLVCPHSVLVLHIPVSVV